MNRNILLLDGHTVQSISVARSLKEKGFNVIAFIEHRISFGFVSTFIDKKIICPILSKEKDRYSKFLFDFLSRNQIEIIIPLYNDSAIFLSKNKSFIEKTYKSVCAIPEFDTFINAFNKEFLMDICKNADLPHPRTAHINSNHSLDTAIKYVGFPALIKPNVSSGARGITLVNSVEELTQKLKGIEKDFGACTLQEYIQNSGVYYNVMIYRDRNGVCTTPVIIKIIRYFPIKGGTSCCCKTIKEKTLHRICEKTLEQLEWHGFADFDIMESINGDFKIIEINPRIPASIHAAFVAGINFPEIIIKDLNGEDVESSYKYEENQYVRFMGLDVMWWLFSPERFKSHPSWFSFLGNNIFYQDGSIKDPLPMLMGFISGIIKYLNPTFRKSKLN